MMKNNLELVQELLENRLDSLNEKIDSNNKNILDRMELIYQQTLKTNGRVTKHDDVINKLITDESNHFNTCPRIKAIEEINTKIEKIDSDNLEVKLIKKYPKMFIMGIVVAVLIIIGTVGYSVLEMHLMVKNVQQTEIKK